MSVGGQNIIQITFRQQHSCLQQAEQDNVLLFSLKKKRKSKLSWELRNQQNNVAAAV